MAPRIIFSFVAGALFLAGGVGYYVSESATRDRLRKEGIRLDAQVTGGSRTGPNSKITVSYVTPDGVSHDDGLDLDDVGTFKKLQEGSQVRIIVDPKGGQTYLVADVLGDSWLRWPGIFTLIGVLGIGGGFRELWRKDRRP
jgi:hypothetical protein